MWKIMPPTCWVSLIFSLNAVLFALIRVTVLWVLTACTFRRLFLEKHFWHFPLIGVIFGFVLKVFWSANTFPTWFSALFALFCFWRHDFTLETPFICRHYHEKIRLNSVFELIKFFMTFFDKSCFCYDVLIKSWNTVMWKRCFSSKKHPPRGNNNRDALA